MAAALTKIVPSVPTMNSVQAMAKKRLHMLVVTAAQVLGDRIDARHPEERHEQKGGDQHGQAAADEVEVHHHHAVAIGVGGHADHVLGADVGDHQRHGHRPPGQRFAARKKSLVDFTPRLIHSPRLTTASK